MKCEQFCCLEKRFTLKKDILNITIIHEKYTNTDLTVFDVCELLNGMNIAGVHFYEENKVLKDRIKELEKKLEEKK